MFMWSSKKPEEKLKWVFKTYDVDRNGKLDSQEVKNLIKVSKSQGKGYSLVARNKHHT